MKKRSFWSWLFLTTEEYEDQEQWLALENAADSIGAQDIALQSLVALDRTQAKEISQLRLTVEVLSEMLIEAKVLDSQTMQDRVNDKLRALEEKRLTLERPKVGIPTVAEGSHPYRGGGIPTQTKTVSSGTKTCEKCDTEVPASDTHITDDGVFCETCYWRRY